MFIGEYKHTIDDKKRLALPFKFRKRIGNSIIITKGFEKCLVVYPEKKWKEISEKLGSLSTTQIERRGLARIMLAGAIEVNPDKLGRVLIPDYLKSYADLKKEIIICGLSNRLEIWDSKKWEEYQKRTEEKFAELAEKLGDSGI